MPTTSTRSALRRTVVATTALLISTSLAACSAGGLRSASAGDEIRIRYATAFGENDTPYQEPAEWIRRVTERVESETDYTVDFEIFPNSSLVPINEMLPAVKDGRADMSIVSVGLFPGDLPLNQLTGVPWLSSNALSTMRAMSELSVSNEDLAEEWSRNGVVPVLWVAAENPATSSKKPIDSLDDLDGIQVRSVGLQAEALKDVGASVVALPSEEVFDALSRGVIDAFSGSPLSTQVSTYKIQDIADHFTDLGMGQYSSAVGVLANADTWDGYPPEVQDIMMEEAGGVLDDFTAPNLAKVHQTVCSELEEAGAKVTRLPDADIEAWKAMSADRVQELYVQQAVEAGVDEDAARALLDDYTTAVAAADDTGSEYVDGLGAC